MPDLSESLSGRRVLVLEDEYLIAMETVRVLAAAGAEIVGPFPHPRHAAAFLASGEAIDAAVLDVHLGEGIRSHDIALALRERSVPFLFQTGYTEEAIPERFSGVHTLLKPVLPEVLTKAVADLLGGDTSGRAS